MRVPDTGLEVFNFEVDTFHTYYAGGILVHNNSGELFDRCGSLYAVLCTPQCGSLLVLFMHMPIEVIDGRPSPHPDHSQLQVEQGDLHPVDV